MLEKNYTNPEDKGRFGFSASGKYNAPYKAEHVIVAVVIGAAAVAFALFVLFMVHLMRSNVTGMSSGITLEAIIIGVSCLIGCAVITAVALLIVKFVMQGIKCTYLADEDKFTAMVGGTPHTIYYKDVQNVHFLPRMFRGAVRGYTVTVKLNGTYEEFGIVSNSYISEQTTPFYIIKERVEAIRAAEERARERRQMTELTEPLPARTNEEKQDTMQRLSSILGKDAEMPGISAASVNNDPLPDISDRVSPTVNGYKDDMPAIGADGKITSPGREYIGSDGRTQSENDIIARGTFRTPAKTSTAVIAAIIAIVVYVIIFSQARLVYSWGIPVGSIGMVLLAPFIAGTIINYLRNGREFKYWANGREFVIASKNTEERFLYKDVQSVNYKKVEHLWFIKGYKVEILTKYGITKYNYVCPGFGRLIPTSYLPFEVIRERIEKK